MNEWNYYDRTARKSLLQSGTCQAGVNSCQVGLLAAPLPRARAAEGGPTLVCASKSQVWKHVSADRDVLPEHGNPPMRGRHCVHNPRRFRTSAWDMLYPRPSRWDAHVWHWARLGGRTRRARQTGFSRDNHSRLSSRARECEGQQKQGQATTMH